MEKGPKKILKCRLLNFVVSLGFDTLRTYIKNDIS